MENFSIKYLNGGKNPSVKVEMGETQGFNVTLRQVEVVSLVGQGMSEKQIASQLGITRNTVKNIKKLILKNTGTISTTELTVLFDQLGLIWPISILGFRSLAVGNRKENEI